MTSVKNILIACSGSVATIKLPVMIQELLNAQEQLPFTFAIKVIVTESAKHFVDVSSLRQSVTVLDDKDEWNTWKERGDPILHIELGKWADLMIIAPLSANTLAKIATGICDNLLLCVARAWNCEKPLFFAPAMNTRMYDHPLTAEHIGKLKSWGYLEIPCISKKLMCADIGKGAMAEVVDIVRLVTDNLLLMKE